MQMWSQATLRSVEEVVFKAFRVGFKHHHSMVDSAFRTPSVDPYDLILPYSMLGTKLEAPRKLGLNMIFAKSSEIAREKQAGS